MNMEEQADEVGKISGPELRMGPIINRRCTDLTMLILFLLLCTFSTYISIFAFSHGKPKELAIPYDSDHYACGRGARLDYPYVYFLSPHIGYLWRTVCVKSCPVSDTQQYLDCYPNSLQKVCKSNQLLSQTPTKKLIKSNKQNINKHPRNGNNKSNKNVSKMRWLLQTTKSPTKMTKSPTNSSTVPDFNTQTSIYKSRGLYGRVCVPMDKLFKAHVAHGLELKNLTHMSRDLSNSWEVMLICVLTAFLIGFLFLITLKYKAKLVIWLFVLMFLATLFSATVIASVTYAHQQHKNPWSLFLAILFAVLTLASTLLVVFNFRRIRLVIAIMKTCSIFISDNVSCLLLPLCHFVTTMSILALWVASTVYLYSLGTVSHSAFSLPFAAFHHSYGIAFMGFFHLFCLFWLINFLKATLQFLLVSATALWYFQFGNRQVVFNPVRTSLYRLFRYHLGTVIAASLLLTVCRPFQLCFGYINNKVQTHPQSGCFQFIGKCCGCWLTCFREFLEYLNKNSYTICAMSGQDFFHSCRDSFFLMKRNVLRFNVLGSIGSVFYLVGVSFITLFTTLVGYLLLTSLDHFVQLVHSPVLPTMVCFLIGLSVAQIFIQVYSQVADALLVLFTIDEEIQKYHGGETQMDKCPKDLVQFINYS